MSLASNPVAPANDRRRWSNLYRKGRRRLLGVLLLLLPWSWFLVRDLWPGLNVASVAMPAIGGGGGLALLAGAAVARRLLPLLVALSLIAMTVVTVVQPLMPQESLGVVRPVTIASANIYDGNQTPKDAAAALAATHADILVAVEVPESFPALLRVDAGNVEPFTVSTQGILIRSAFPIEAVPVSDRLSATRVLMAPVTPPDGAAFTVFAVHAINPIQESSFVFQQRFVDRLDKSALERQGASGPVVIAGDLNLSDRTNGYRILSSDFRDAMRAGAWAGDTYIQGIWRFAFLRIDHIFVSRTWCAADPSRFSVPGSDHEGIRATIGACA
jgi:endonuclease/exonuclease/phosphatase (EEP) superfamily protein YafD